jgi:hypothetical protein
MADRFWVGGSANWDANTGRWSATSGGAGGATVPTTSDDVYFDANSGAITATLSGARSCKNLIFTGFTGTFNFGTYTLTCAGTTVLFVSGMTVSTTSGTLLMNSAGTNTITSAGKTLPMIIISGVGGTTTLQDNLTCTGISLLNATTFSDGNKNITCSLGFSIGTNATANLGTGILTISGLGTPSGYPFIMSTGANISVNSAHIIKLTDSSNDIARFNITDGSETFGTLWFDRGASTGEIIIVGATNTFAEIKDTGTEAHTITFPNTTTTVSAFNVNGSSGKLITMRRTGGSGTWTVSKSSGTVSCDYLSISNSTATGGATWYAGANSTDGGGNSGWTFSAPVTSNIKTYNTNLRANIKTINTNPIANVKTLDTNTNT